MAQLNYLRSSELQFESDQGARSAKDPFSTVFQSKQAFDKQYKVIIIGDSSCGKTSMLLRVGEGKPFASHKTEPTIGVDCKSKTFLHEDLKVRLQLWDTAGQERFRTLTTSYYRGTHCCVLVFDITNPESFYHLYQWIDQYNFYCEFPMKNIIIVGNKYDMEAKRQVSELEIRQFCESMDCLYVRCSVLSDEGVEALITAIISKCIELEDKVVGAGVTAGAKSQSNIFSLGGSDGITSGDIGNINPMRLDVPKKKAACCLKGQ